MTEPISSDERVRRVVDFYATVSPDSLDRIDALYAPDAGFKDPFNEVRGRQAIRKVFEHMYRQVHAPRFVVHSAVAQGDFAMLTWTMHYLSSARSADEQSIRGCTELRFDSAGQVALHVQREHVGGHLRDERGAEQGERAFVVTVDREIGRVDRDGARAGSGILYRAAESALEQREPAHHL